VGSRYKVIKTAGMRNQSNAPPQKSLSVLPLGALALAGSLWGTAFLFGKIAFREMSVSQNVALRFCFASAVLLPVLFRRTRHFTCRDFGIMLTASVVGIPLQFLVQFKGLASEMFRTLRRW
jgi:drug/metabolite transporter (DMT)-like permease